MNFEGLNASTFSAPGFRWSWRPCSKRGFTLVELLVCLVIAAILLALVSVGVSKMQNAAKESACLYKLRQVGIGLLGCMSENQGRPYPYNPGDAGVWTVVVDDYLGGDGSSPEVDLPIWACPMSYPTGYAKLTGGTGLTGSRTSWAGNSTLGSAFATLENPPQIGVSGAYLYSQVRTPSKTVYVMERNMIDYSGTGATFYNYNQFPPGMHQTSATPKPLGYKGHRGGNSLLFLDGHAEHATVDHPAYSPSISIRRPYWDPAVQ